MRYLILAWVFFSISFAGCSIIDKAKDNYNACRGDKACMEQMENVRASTEVATRTVGNTFFPSPLEAVVYLVSNLAAFGFGVVKGKRKMEV